MAFGAIGAGASGNPGQSVPNFGSLMPGAFGAGTNVGGIPTIPPGTDPTSFQQLLQAQMLNGSVNSFLGNPQAQSEISFTPGDFGAPTIPPGFGNTPTNLNVPKNPFMPGSLSEQALIGQFLGQNIQYYDPKRKRYMTGMVTKIGLDGSALVLELKDGSSVRLNAFGDVESPTDDQAISKEQQARQDYQELLAQRFANPAVDGLTRSQDSPDGGLNVKNSIGVPVHYTNSQTGKQLTGTIVDQASGPAGLEDSEFYYILDSGQQLRFEKFN